MARFSSSSSCSSKHGFIFHGILLLQLLLLLLSHVCFQLASCGTIVKYLPGFQGPLPFLLETGYIGVGENDDVQAFYYFIESENNPKEDPLMLWLTGGPGCSSFSGLVFEIGPIAFKNEEYIGCLPNLVLRPHSWTKVSNIIFVDSPVSTGFTYARTQSANKRSDLSMVHQTHQFLRKWLIDHPEFQSNEVYIAGDSYSGITIPPIVQLISQGNDEGVQTRINLQGYLLGNPVTTRREKNYKIPFTHGMGLISDELYESLKQNCKGEYKNVDPKDVLCSRDMESFNEAVTGINTGHILEPLCDEPINSPTPLQGCSWRRSLYHKSNINLTLPPLSCRTYGYCLCFYWANDDKVRNALHIRKGSIGKWKRCSDDVPQNMNIASSFEYHVNLSRKGYRSLIYSGDHDFVIPFMATQEWIRALNYSIVDDWRQWHTNGQVAGYTRTYSNQMTFATVKGGGHTAPEYKPQECFAMFSRWLFKKPL